MSDVCFMDTEATGLSPDDEIWEFAAIRRNADGSENELHLIIAHDQMKAEFLPVSFFKDYKARCPQGPNSWKGLTTQPSAARQIQEITLGAHIVGAVPNFDTERLAKLLRTYRLEPKWHYHLIDCETLAVGFLAGRGQIPPLPWKSDDLSRAIGVDPDQYERHTALGDVLWVRAQYDAIMEKV